eukprot:430994_1
MSSSRLLYRKNIHHHFKLASHNSNLAYYRLLTYKPYYEYQYRSIIISKSNHILSTKNINNIPIFINHNKLSFCTNKPTPPNTQDENMSENNDENEWEYREVDNETLKTKNYQPLTWKVVIGTIIFFGIGTIIFQQQIHKHRQKQRAPEYASYGEAQIGIGEWKMTDHNNKLIDQNTLMGKYQIVYFGFTFCPDVCPRELTKMAHAMQLLEERGYSIGIEGDILPVFVSVDPKRDTPALIKKYIRQFHPQIYGLTGSPQQVAKFAKAYKAYFSTPGPGENTDDYIIDHVTMMYVMGRTGEYIGHISTLENAHEMANKIAAMIKEFGHKGGFFGTWFKDPSTLIQQKT